MLRKLLIVALLTATCSTVASASTSGPSDLARARHATAKFRNLVAKTAG